MAQAATGKEQTGSASSVRNRTETKQAVDGALSAPLHGAASRRCSGGIVADSQRSVLRAQPHAGARDRRRGLRVDGREAGGRSVRRIGARRSEYQVPEAYGGVGAAVHGKPTDGAERGADGEGRHLGRERHRQRRLERHTTDGRAQLRAAAEREGRVDGRCAARVGERRGAGVRNERRGAAARPQVPDPGVGAGRGGRAQREVGGQGGAGGGEERVALAAQGLPLRRRRGRGGRGGRGGLRRGAEHPEDAYDPYDEAVSKIGHELFDLHVRIEKILRPLASLDKPQSLQKFTKKANKSSPSIFAAKDLAFGKFATVTALVNMLFDEDKNLQPPQVSNHINDNPTKGHTAHTPSEPNANDITYASMVRRQIPPPAATPKPSRLPSINPNIDSGEQEKDIDFNDFTISRKSLKQMRPIAIGACGYEQKGFALLHTHPNFPALRNAKFLTSILARGGLRVPLTVMRTSDTHTFLAYAPLSCLPNIEQAYSRFRELNIRQGGFHGLPPLKAKALQNITDACEGAENGTELFHIIHSLRSEIYRLEDKTLSWRPKQYFSDALRLHEEDCYNKFKNRHPDSNLQPVNPPPRSRSRQAANDGGNGENDRPQRELLRRCTTATDAAHRTDASLDNPLRNTAEETLPIPSGSPAL
ncbi:sulfite oxidase [Gracilaria domingensis]|nr:sulfite oxidase [Gracilaria domingensis]